jgi:hypothetical protein
MFRKLPEFQSQKLADGPPVPVGTKTKLTGFVVFGGGTRVRYLSRV